MWKSRLKLVHRNDAEIKYLVEDEDDLSSEIESNGTFNEKFSISIARLESLNITYRQKETSSRSSNPGGSSANTTTKMKLPKLTLPSFTDSYTECTSIIDLLRVCRFKHTTHQLGKAKIHSSVSQGRCCEPNKFSYDH